MSILLKSLLAYFGGLAVIAAMLFLPAGTLDYWQAWAYLAVLFVPMFFVVLYFLSVNPAFLERRFKMKEKEREQKKVASISSIVFLVGFLLPGLDIRFGWSSMQPWVSLAGLALVFISYIGIYWVFHENSWAGRTIRVEKGQKVISTGPYAIVRHPMYAAVTVLTIATPLALGSYVALVPYLFVAPLLAMRIGNEEEVLHRELKGYGAYCRKVRYRLVPGIW